MGTSEDICLLDAGQELVPVFLQAMLDGDVCGAAFDPSLKALASGQQLFQVFAYEGFVAYRQEPALR